MTRTALGPRAAPVGGDAHSPRRALDRVRARLSSCWKLICKQTQRALSGRDAGPGQGLQPFSTQALLVTE